MGAFDRRLREEADRAGALALPPGPVSNGEFIPAGQREIDNEIVRQTRLLVDAAARRAGMDRRRFLQTAGGVAASLAIFNLTACSRTTSGRRGVAPTSSPGGRFTVPPATDVAACEHALAGDQFIFDVHTHHVMPHGPWRRNAPETVRLIERMLPADCHSPDSLECVNRASYLHDL